MAMLTVDFSVSTVYPDDRVFVMSCLNHGLRQHADEVKSADMYSLRPEHHPFHWDSTLILLV